MDMLLNEGYLNKDTDRFDAAYEKYFTKVYGWYTMAS